MNPDKRSVSTDALATLGTIIQDGGRDAIHLAVEPVIAGESLIPGANIGISSGKAYNAGDGIKALGIVDPFLQSTINPGEKFWLIVYPRQITSLRHVWSHPDFEDNPIIKPDKIVSEQWLRDFCERNDCPGYEHVIEVCKAVCEDREIKDEDYSTAYDVYDHYITFRGSDAHCEVPDEFWEHFEIVTGLRPIHRITYFSCTC